MSNIDELIKKLEEQPDSEGKTNGLSKLNQLKEQYQSLVNRRDLVLKVRVRTIDDAEQIHDWMFSPYSDGQPMTSVLESVSWNSRIVNEREYEILQKIKDFKFYND